MQQERIFSAPFKQVLSLLTQKMRVGAASTQPRPYTPWKSAAKLDLVRALYGDNKDLMERESMGAITADADSVFAEKMIDTWLQMKPLESDPEFFFTAVDPTGGGQSYMAIVSLVLVGTECYIVGLDASPANGTEEIRTY